VAEESAEEPVKDKKQERIDELEDKVKRQLAEFETSVSVPKKKKQPCLKPEQRA
jgi:hypothetical protein